MIVKTRPLTVQRGGNDHLANLYAHLGRFRETSQMLDHAIEIDLELGNETNLASTYVQQAFWLMVGGNNRERAEEVMGKVLELGDFGTGASYYQLLIVYLNLGEYEKASQVVQEHLIHIVPTVGQLLSGYRHMAWGEYDESIEAFRKAQYGWGHGGEPGNLELGRLYLNLGDYQKALETARRMQRFHTYYATRAMQYPRSFYLMGQIYEQQGDRKLAIENYGKFLDLWKDADEGLPELIDAKARHKRLKTLTSS